MIIHLGMLPERTPCPCGNASLPGHRNRRLTSRQWLGDGFLPLDVDEQVRERLCNQVTGAELGQVQGSITGCQCQVCMVGLDRSGKFLAPSRSCRQADAIRRMGVSGAVEAERPCVCAFPEAGAYNRVRQVVDPVKTLPMLVVA